MSENIKQIKQISDQSDSSDSSEPIFKKNETVKGISIDDLLEERERESKEQSEYEGNQSDGGLSESSSVEFFVPPFKIEKLPDNDPSIFDFHDFSFPMEIFDKMHYSHNDVDITIPPVEEWKVLALENFEDFVPYDPLFFFSLIIRAIELKTPESGLLIIKYSSKIQKNSIDFTYFVHCIRLCAEKVPEMLCFLLGSVTTKSFIVKSEEETKDIHFDLILLHCAAILTSKAINNPLAFYMIDQLRTLLLSTILESPVIEELGDILVSICFSMECEVLSQVTTYFPLTGSGSDLMIYFGLHMISGMMESEYPPTIEWLPKTMEGLKNKCAQTPLIASGVASVVHMVVAAAIKSGEIDQETIQGIIEAMKFNIPCTDIAMLTMLKEQLQVTRTQIDMLMRASFTVSSQTYG